MLCNASISLFFIPIDINGTILRFVGRRKEGKSLPAACYVCALGRLFSTLTNLLPFPSVSKMAPLPYICPTSEHALYRLRSLFVTCQKGERVYGFFTCVFPRTMLSKNEVVKSIQSINKFGSDHSKFSLFHTKEGRRLPRIRFLYIWKKKGSVSFESRWNENNTPQILHT